MFDPFFSSLMEFRRPDRRVPLALAAVSPMARLEMEASRGMRLPGVLFLRLFHGEDLFQLVDGDLTEMRKSSSWRSSVYHYLQVFYRFTPSSLAVLRWWLRKCERLGFYLALNVSDASADVVEKLSKCRNLISLCGLPSSTSEYKVRAQFGASWETIRYLDHTVASEHLDEAVNLTPFGEMASLEILSLHAFLIDSESVQVLRQCRNLSTILINKGIRTDSLRELGKLPALRNLSLRGCFWVDDWSPLAACHHLEVLLIEFPKHLPELVDLSNFAHLEYLVINSSKNLSNLILPRDGRLRHLSVSFCASLVKISDLRTNDLLTSLELSGCHALRSLDITGCTALKSFTLERTEKMKSIMVLETVMHLNELKLAGEHAAKACGVSVGDGACWYFPSTLPFAASLVRLAFWDIDEATKFDVSSLVSLRSLEILRLAALSVGGSQNSLRLQVVRVADCPQFPSLDFTGSLALTDFSIHNCHCLTEIRGITDKPLLRKFGVTDCPMISSIQLGDCPSLEECDVRFCNTLVTLKRNHTENRPAPTLRKDLCPLLLDVEGFRAPERIREQYVWGDRRY